jgi:hypothetical protein
VAGPEESSRREVGSAGLAWIPTAPRRPNKRA